MNKFNKLFYSGLGTVLLFVGAGIAIFGTLISSSYNEKVVIPKDNQNIFQTPVQDTVKPTKVNVIKPKSRKKAMVIDTTKTVIVIDTTKHEEHI